MGRKDVLTKKYMRRPEIFADFFNGYLYNGKEVLKAENLSEMDASSVASIPLKGKSKNITLQRYRDVIKKAIVMKSDSIYYMLLGIENQTDVHYAMPVRNMLYNALAYTEQVERIGKQKQQNFDDNDTSRNYSGSKFLSDFGKDDRLIPVITVTLYWGDKPWDGPLSLKDMLVDTDKKLLTYVDDVRCNLFSIIDANKLPKYHTDLAEVFSVLRFRNDKVGMYEMISKEERFQHVNKDAAALMQEFASIKRPRVNKEGEYNMCKAIRELTEDWYNDGMEKGMEKGRKVGMDLSRIESIKAIMHNGKMTYIQACSLMGLSEDDRNKYKDRVGEV